MFVVSEKGIKDIMVWLNDPSELEPDCLEQAKKVAALPQVWPWMALMPDAHLGYAFPIGSVVPVKDAVFPYGVGMDIGCGVRYMRLGVEAEILQPHKLRNQIASDILARVPVGFNHHKTRQSYDTSLFESARDKFGDKSFRALAADLIEKSRYSIGTLGGGNHFIELVEDDTGTLGILVHTGSRNLGTAICKYFHQKAKQYHNSELAWLPVDSREGQQYIALMNAALHFARVNRDRVINVVYDVVCHRLGRKLEVKEEIDCHHNYMALEKHQGQELYVHRKGAIRIGKDELGIVPGAMGSKSYVVRGKGNPQSFHSCSHGAGRKLSRRQALDTITPADVMTDLLDRDVILAVPDARKISDESRHAYKDIDDVMSRQADLVEIRHSLRALIVVKGT